MPHVALLTDIASRDIDDDLAPLTTALVAAGATVTRPAWDDPSASFDGVDRVVIRSPWAYHECPDRFCDFLDELATRVPVDNPPEVVRWNTDKRYLHDLAAAGIPITPTTFFPPGATFDLSVLAECTTDDVVVKPSISAGSRNTARYRASDSAAVVAHVEALQRSGQVAMVQPYLVAVDTAGETAVVLIDGVVSHGLRKGPLLRLGAGLVEGLFAVEEMAPRTPTPQHLALVDTVRTFLHRRFAPVFGDRPLLYARVDLVDDDDGRPVVLEIELNEPSLFHDHAPGSAERFADAILRRC